MPPFQRGRGQGDWDFFAPNLGSAHLPRTIAEGLAFFLGEDGGALSGRRVARERALTEEQQQEMAKSGALVTLLESAGVLAQKGTIHTYSVHPDGPGYEILLAAFREEMARAQGASEASGYLPREKVSPTSLELFEGIGGIVGEIQKEGFDPDKVRNMRPEVNDNLKHLYRKYPEEGEPLGVGFHVLFSVGEDNRLWSVSVKTLTPADGPGYVTVEREIRLNLATGSIEAFLDRGPEHRP